MNEAGKQVKRYGETASYETPIDNHYVIELLNRLGFDTIDALLSEGNIFTRTFVTGK